jgi:hypothetical protein
MQFAAAWLLVSVSVAASPDTPKFDGRGWTVGHQQQNDFQSITEFVLPGQTVDNWKEMVTSEVYFRPIPMPAFVDRMKAKLANGCPSLVFTVIRQDDKSAVVEWRDSGCGGFDASSEVARYSIEKEGLYRLAYTVKGSMKTERRKDWMAILDQTPLAEGAFRAKRQTRTEGQDPEQAARMAKVSQILAGFIRQGLNPCTNPKAELKEQTPGPAGPLTEFLLECSEGRYTIMVAPNGAMTSWPAK